MESVTSRQDITDLNNKNRENNKYAPFNKTSFPKSAENLKSFIIIKIIQTIIINHIIISKVCVVKDYNLFPKT